MNILPNDLVKKYVLYHRSTINHARINSFWSFMQLFSFYPFIQNEFIQYNGSLKKMNSTNQRQSTVNSHLEE
jgi:hypothetical protein